ncbi:MAG: DUF4330 domain-containing protein [Tissierellia bacterium]|nr:DUF4330 domain-containing protein [Tissierellia bacterium]
MPLLDEKGRLFGKINILDLFIILMIGILSIGGFYKLRRIDPTDIVIPKPIELKIIVLDREKIGVDMIKEGDILKEYDTGTVLGKIKKVEVYPASTEVETVDGEIKIAEIPDRYDLIITIDGKATVTENSIISGKSELRVGSKLVLRTQTYALSSTILEINLKEE